MSCLFGGDVHDDYEKIPPPLPLNKYPRFPYFLMYMVLNVEVL